MSLLETAWQHEFITTNGVRLHYVTQGEGPLMLMLHGFPEFWYSWRHQIPEFAKDYKVVALDLRGYNDSEKPQDVNAYRMEELLGDVEGVIRALGYERCVLVGHDWGGAIAWFFADRFPQLLDKLIVLNLPHPAKFAEGLQTNPRQLLRSWYIFFFQLPWLPEFLLGLNDCSAIADAFSQMAIDKSAFAPTDLQAFQNAAGKPGALTAMLNYYRNVFPILTRSRPWNILEVPTLLIWGEEDTALGKELTHGTEALVRDFQIHYIPNCSHWVQQERPELVNQYMREFLDREIK
ncbi:alpha/beta hydrolase [Oscillatoria sp. FACHB-1406]|uniref:alpha/beta fold hydrolase n=1 Tax=Oscillatoria sp. FACHB-1406 TaxID=2692846 RepID=UPI0016879A67|nr:alpha/beta hydrolase [Oscillatoria sp. FACHB-1406]MBD2578623.1 alpha/beta hydrolase [Oscillatoria sp. FACHB-1406]